MKSTYRRLIIVVGAHGRQGSSVIRSLREYPDQWIVRGIVPDFGLASVQDLIEKGIDLIKCDINNRENCTEAFNGAYGVFAVTNYFEANVIGEYEQAINLIQAAKEANVKHFIFSLFPELDRMESAPADSLEESRRETRIKRYLRELPVSAAFAYTTLIRVGYYYQNLMMFLQSDRATLEFRYPLLNNNRIPFYDVRDTGQMIVQCLQQPDRWRNHEVIPIVAEHLSMNEMCALIETLTDKNVKFTPLSYGQALKKLNPRVLNTMRWYAMHAPMDDLQAEITREICPNLKTFRDWMVETIYQLK